MGLLSLFLGNQVDGIFRAHRDTGTATGAIVFGDLRDGDMAKLWREPYSCGFTGVSAGLAVDIGLGKAVIPNHRAPRERLTCEVKHRFRTGSGALTAQRAPFAGKADLRETAITAKQHIFGACIDTLFAPGALIGYCFGCPGWPPLGCRRPAAAQKQPAGLVNSHTRRYPPGGPGGPMNTWDIQTRNP
jgi:hypothetical protein